MSVGGSELTGLVFLIPAMSSFVKLSSAFTEAVMQVVQGVQQRDRVLQSEKQAFAETRATCSALNCDQSECQYLDVGGQRYHASRRVLQTPQAAFFASLASGTFSSEADLEGYTFLDRDPRWFSVVLGYLRGGARNVVLPADRRVQAAIAREAKYFTATELLELITTKQPCLIGMQERKMGVGGWELVAHSTVTGSTHRTHRKPWRQVENYTTCSVDGYVYVAGGYNSLCLMYPPWVERYNSRTMQWEDVQGEFLYPGGTEGGCLLHMDGQLLLIGGDRRQEGDDYEVPIATRSVQCLDLVSGVCQRMPKLLQARSEFAACVVAGRVIVVGGMGRNKVVLSSVEEYDLINKRWNPLPSMPTARARCTAVAYKGLLVVLGGIGPPCGGCPTCKKSQSQPCSAVEAFDPATNCWTSLTPMPAPRSWPPAVVLGNELVVCGVRCAGAYTAHVYNPRDGCWHSSELHPAAQLRVELPPVHVLDHQPF